MLIGQFSRPAVSAAISTIAFARATRVYASSRTCFRSVRTQLQSVRLIHTALKAVLFVRATAVANVSKNDYLYGTVVHC